MIFFFISGCLLLLCSLYLGFNIHLNLIQTIHDYEKNQESVLRTMLNLEFYLRHIGVLFGCILCGLNPNTWPTTKVNVRTSVWIQISNISE